MKATGRVIGVPHNIESLVNSQSIDQLSYELSTLIKCDSVFAISKEETWLLRLFGVEAHYLPYYPPKEVENYLHSIKDARRATIIHECNKIIMLGSATNIPTRLGMQSLINFASKQNLQFELIVAGYGTMDLQVSPHPRINLKGAISNEELKELLIDSDAILIYQPPTTGALTRIPEMLVAGIPIIANFDAVRNYHNIEGIYQYNTFDEMIDLIDNLQPVSLDTYKKQISNEIEFIRVVSSYYDPT